MSQKRLNKSVEDATEENRDSNVDDLTGAILLALKCLKISEGSRFPKCVRP